MMTLALINSMAGENQFDMESISSASQKVISQAIDANFVKELLEHAVEERDQARLKSVGMKHAGDWLNAVPVKALGLHLRPLEFTTSAKYRLGMPVFSKTAHAKHAGRTLTN